jgi:hypothetical protein
MAAPMASLSRWLAHRLLDLGLIEAAERVAPRH